MSEIHNRVRPQSIELLRRDYTANGGWETFLSYEDPEQDILVGLLRLRKCSEEGTFRKELVGVEGGCSIVRELVSVSALSHSTRMLLTHHALSRSMSTVQPSRFIPGTPRSFNIKVLAPF